MTFQKRPYTFHTSFVSLIMSQLEDRISSEFKIVFFTFEDRILQTATFTFEDRLLKFSRSVFFPSKDRIVLAKRPSTFSLRTIYFLHFTSYVSIIVSQPEDRISYELKIVYFTLEGRIQFKGRSLSARTVFITNDSSNSLFRLFIEANQIITVF